MGTVLVPSSQLFCKPKYSEIQFKLKNNGFFKLFSEISQCNILCWTTQKLLTEDEVHICYYLDFDFIYFLLLVIHGIANVYLAASVCIIVYISIKS